ncbi:HNH endonuclease [Pseudescherichia vulneris]|uniref:HNH endonuclease n=1 Tax=Pseudescherichia vulneris TaxID=566 RepID=UPI0028AD6DD5|nr:HNH endonuclease [Pseudescherichia vulneris]
MVIFGAWDSEKDNERTVILKEQWKTNTKNQRQKGYNQALHHIELIQAGYDLYTFDMIFSEHPHNPEIAVIKDFERKIEKRFLRKEGTTWYADFLQSPFPDEIPSAEGYIEGAKKQVTVNSYERNQKARQACIDYYGAACLCCNFNFEKVYGEHGKGFIHVHHIKPLYTLEENYIVNPITDLIPLCPNCHAMIHRGNKVLDLDELKDMLVK